MRRLIQILLLMVLLMPTLNQINKSLLAGMTSNASQYENLLLNYKDNLVQAYQNSLMSINVDMAKTYALLGGNISLDEANRYGRLDKLFNKITLRLKKLGVEETNIIKKGMAGTLNNGYVGNAYVYEQSFNATMGFTLLDDAAVQASLVNPLSKIKWQNSVKTNINTLNNQVRSQITEGLIQGKGYKDTARLVSKTIMNFTDATDIKGAVTKAFKIVSTETHRVQNLGADLAFNDAKKSADKLGVEFRKVWVSTLDRKTRDTHQSADTTLADEEGFFHLFGATFESPGNSGIGSEDIYCRCSFSVKIPEVKNKKRFDNVSKKPTANVSYCTWYKKKYGKAAKGCSPPSTPKIKPDKGKTTGVSRHKKKRNTVIPSNALDSTKSIDVLSQKQFNKNYNLQVKNPSYRGNALSGRKFLTQSKDGNIPSTISKNEYNTMFSYTNDGYSVNYELRKSITKRLKYKLDAMDIAYTKNLNHVLNKLPNYKGTSYRIVSKSNVNLSRYKAGNTITYDTFLSTGREKSTFVQYNWNNPDYVSFIINGKNGKKIEAFSNYRSELEVLFGSNSTFVVEKVQETAQGIKVYLNEIL